MLEGGQLMIAFAFAFFLFCLTCWMNTLLFALFCSCKKKRRP